jgi:hypothetical protein
MRLKPLDFFYYSYCPLFYDLKDKHQNINQKQTLLEQKLSESIIETEKRCLLKDSIVSPRKIFRMIDNLWWPAATENNIPAKEIEEKAIKASKLAADYCKYDFAEYENIATDIDISVNIGDSVLVNNYNIIKKDYDGNVIILDLVRKNINQFNIFGDIGVAASCYIIAKNANQTTGYINILIDETKQNIETSIYWLKKSQLAETEKMLRFFEYGLRGNVRFPNKWNCKECKACKSLFSLTNEDIR